MSHPIPPSVAPSPPPVPFGVPAPAVLLALGLAVLAGGCSAFRGEDPRACPTVRIDAATADFTRYRPGGGKDVTDVVLTGEVAGYDGSCTYDDEGVTVDMVLSFSLGLGPAATGREGSFRYFVALPDYYPNPRAKSVFETAFVFPDSVNRVRYRDEEVSLRIPLASETESAAEREIYVGFQLSPDEYRDNRRRSGSGR